MYFIVSLFLATGFYMTTFKKECDKMLGHGGQGDRARKGEIGRVVVLAVGIIALHVPTDLAACRSIHSL